MDWLEYENIAYSDGYEIVCGVDEAGRGPLAGPVYAAAVILPKGHIKSGGFIAVNQCNMRLNT